MDNDISELLRKAKYNIYPRIENNKLPDDMLILLDLSRKYKPRLMFIDLNNKSYDGILLKEPIASITNNKTFDNLINNRYTELKLL
jgi:hypothetical protein